MYVSESSPSLRARIPVHIQVRLNVLTLSSPGFLARHSPGGGAQSAPPYHNFFVIGRIMMKLGKLVKCFKLYLMMGFWWVNWL